MLGPVRVRCCCPLSSTLSAASPTEKLQGRGAGSMAVRRAGAGPDGGGR